MAAEDEDLGVNPVPVLGRLRPAIRTDLGIRILRALPRQLAKGNLYMMLLNVAYLDLSGPLSYYYTATKACVPGGPAGDGDASQI